jgi:thiamine biosynthesis lipoprotein
MARDPIDVMRLDRRSFLMTTGRAGASMLTASIVPAWFRPGDTSGLVNLGRSVFAMGTTVTITAFGRDRATLVAATGSAFEELYALDRTLSVFRPESEISRLNRAGVGESVSLSPATLEALAAAGRYTEMTDGGFDCTVGGLLSVWGFHDEITDQRPISDTALEDAIDGMGWHRVVLGTEGTAWRTHRATRIDLGGIGVGFTVDRMGEILRSHGIESALIDHSGDLLAIGRPPDADGWNVAIPDPEGSGPHLLELTLRDQALSTSSNRRTTRHVQGRTIGHIIDPRTGENPCGHLGVSVLAPTSTEADALSTALFVDADLDGQWRNGRREAIFVRAGDTERSVERIR